MTNQITHMSNKIEITTVTSFPFPHPAVLVSGSIDNDGGGAPGVSGSSGTGGGGGGAGAGGTGGAGGSG